MAATAEAQRIAALAVPPRSAADLWAEIIGLENADRLGWAGMQRLSDLQAEYHRATATAALAA